MPYGEYIHKMHRIDKPGYHPIDIEDEFQGLIFLSAEGMNNIGKSKNVVTESYPESDNLRVYLPAEDTAIENGIIVDSYTNEATVITMKFAIIGDAEMRQRTFDNFVDYIRHGIHLYWDTARNREFRFIVTDEIKTSAEQWHGSMPYIVIEVPMQNLNGRTTLKE